MKNNSLFAALIISVFSMVLSHNAFAANSPEGLWVAYSPFFEGRPVAVIKTYLVNKKLYGQLVKVIPLNGSIPGAKIAKSGPVMMYGFQERNGEWVNGYIYEQITARIYKSTLTVGKDGRSLYVRGWKGPFFRTARWARID